ncbi:MAG: radical SAM protein [Candidatus Bathyarchaeia archaeon]
MDGRLDCAPTTAYLMTYKNGKCTANCGFCPQARRSQSRSDMLSRVSWPAFPTENVVEGLCKAVENNRIRRVCIQAINYPKVFEHLMLLTKMIRPKIDVPISISCQPLNSKNLRLLAESSVDRVGIPLDAATKEIFNMVKGPAVDGPYTWEKQWRLLNEAVKIFGKGKVSTHLIVGLGETEKEIIKTIQKCTEMGVLPALFAFTPIPGTALEKWPQPKIESYRRIQLARYLIVHGFVRYKDMRFNSSGCLINFGINKQKLVEIVKTGEPFLTSGCPNCNRPYYNEKPSGPIYNYPRKISGEELIEIGRQLNLH